MLKASETSGRRRRARAALYAAGAVAAGVPLVPASAAAQEAAPIPAQAAPVQEAATSEPQLQDIVVTAQRRSERLQDVPLAVSTFSAETIGRQGVVTTAELSQIAPSLVFNRNANVASPYIRGIGSAQIDPTSESPVAIYVDDVYIAAPQSNVFTLAGIKQIDVLAGPQGTLFGRNATGGVIQIQTLDPQQATRVDAAATYASYDFTSASLYATTGITDNVAVNLSALYENQGKGYGRNLFTGGETFKQAIHDFSLRNKWMIDLPTGTVLRLSADYADLENTNAYQKPRGTASPLNGDTYPGRFNALSDQDTRTRTRTGGGSIRIDQDAGPIAITSITAYRKTKAFFLLDNDVSSAPVVTVELNQRFRNFSQEIRIANRNPSDFTWIVGGYYYNAKGAYDPFRVNGDPVIPYDSQRTESLAGFAQASYKFLENTQLTGGIRYTDERQEFELPVAGLSQKQKVDKVTYRVALDHHFTDDILAYVSHNTGFKSGGFNLLAPGNVFLPENLEATEVGVKSELFGRRLRLNVSAFYYDYTDQQFLLIQRNGTIVDNAAASEIKGLEVNFDALPAKGLQISGGLSLLDGEYKNFPGLVPVDRNGATSAAVNGAGNRTVSTPKTVLSFSSRYTKSTSVGTFEGDVGVQYNSGFFWLPDNRLRQPSYAVVNAGIGWSPVSERFGARLWVRNLANSTYYLSRVSLVSLGDAQVQAAPRTIGLTLSYRYRE